MKRLKLGVLVGALLLSSSVYARVDNLSYKIGAGSATLGGLTSTLGYASSGKDTNGTGLFLGMEMSFMGSAQERQDDKFNTYLDYELQTLDGWYLASFGFGARYKIVHKVELGAKVLAQGLHGAYTNVEFIGFGWGIDTKYSFSKNHGAVLGYTRATLTESSSGLLKTDATTLNLSYIYSF